MKKSNLWIETLETRSLLTPVVAIIDSGADINHEALKNYIWKNPGEIASNNIDDDNNGYIDDINGWNFADGSANVLDGYGHGTHVAGIVASYGAVSIMVLKFQNDSGLGYTGAAISAINYAIMMKKNYGIDIVAINNSWGGTTGTSFMLERAIQTASDANIVFVAAAGNNGSDNDLVPRYPSSYPQTNVIAVAAVGYDNQTLAGFSNYGKNSVDLAARGTAIYSTLPGNQYGYISGTSMAAPQVAGAIAAICNKYGNLSVAEIKERIFSTVTKSIYLTDKVYTGGSLNITGALSSDVPIVVKPPTPPSPPVPPIVVKSWDERIVGRTDVFNITRVRGWVLDTDHVNDRVRVKVVINNRSVVVVDANKYRSDLVKYGDRYHGFDVRLNRKMFNRGWNEVKIFAENKDTGELKMIATKRIRRII